MSKGELLASFFIAGRPRVRGYASRERREWDRTVAPAREHFPRPLPRSRRLAVEYRFTFRDPGLSPVSEAGNKRLLRIDIDNLLKWINDALTGVVWADDSQIFDMRATKSLDEVEGVQVTVWELGEDGHGE